MTWRDELKAQQLSVFSSREGWPPEVEISDRNFKRIVEAGGIPEERADEFRQVLLDAHANAFNVARRAKLMRTKRQFLEVYSDAEAKLRNFRRVLKDDNCLILRSLQNHDCAEAIRNGETDWETIRGLHAEAERDLDALDRIADRLEAILANLPDKEGSNNSPSFERHCGSA